MTSIFEENDLYTIDHYERIFEPYIAEMGLWRIRAKDSRQVPTVLADLYTDPTNAKRAIERFVSKQELMALELAKNRKRRELTVAREAEEAPVEVAPEPIVEEVKEEPKPTSKSQVKRIKAQKTNP